MVSNRRIHPGLKILPAVPAVAGVLFGAPFVVSSLLSGHVSAIATVAIPCAAILLFLGLLVFTEQRSFAPALRHHQALRESDEKAVSLIVRWTKEARNALRAGPEEALQRDLVVTVGADYIRVWSSKGRLLTELARNQAVVGTEFGNVFESTPMAPVRRGGLLLIEFENQSVRLPILDPTGRGIRFAGPDLTRRAGLGILSLGQS